MSSRGCARSGRHALIPSATRRGLVGRGRGQQERDVRQRHTRRRHPARRRRRISFGEFARASSSSREQQVRGSSEPRGAPSDLRRDPQSVMGEADRVRLASRLLASALDVVGAERGFVLVIGPDGTLKAQIGGLRRERHVRDGRFEGSWGAIRRRAGDARAPGRLRRRAADELLVIAQRGRAGDRRAGVCPPPRGPELAGSRSTRTARNGGRFTDLDLEILKRLANHAALVLAGMPDRPPDPELLARPGEHAAPNVRIARRAASQ